MFMIKIFYNPTDFYIFSHRISKLMWKQHKDNILHIFYLNIYFIIFVYAMLKWLIIRFLYLYSFISIYLLRYKTYYTNLLT